MSEGSAVVLIPTGVAALAAVILVLVALSNDDAAHFWVAAATCFFMAFCFAGLSGLLKLAAASALCLGEIVKLLAGTRR